MCCYRLRGGEGTKVDRDEAVYGVGYGVRYVSSTGSGRLLLWVIEDPREILRWVARGERAAAFDTLLYDLEREVFLVLQLGQAADRGTMAVILVQGDPKELPTAPGRRRVEVWGPSG
jgi:hypothetical protein